VVNDLLEKTGRVEEGKGKRKTDHIRTVWPERQGRQIDESGEKGDPEEFRILQLMEEFEKNKGRRTSH